MHEWLAIVNGLLLRQYYELYVLLNSPLYIYQIHVYGHVMHSISAINILE